MITISKNISHLSHNLLVKTKRKPRRRKNLDFETEKLCNATQCYVNITQRFYTTTENHVLANTILRMDNK